MYGKSPFNLVRRRLCLMKNREGVELDFDINFKFAPVNFEEVPADDLQFAPVVDTSWMV